MNIYKMTPDLAGIFKVLNQEGILTTKVRSTPRENRSLADASNAWAHEFVHKKEPHNKYCWVVVNEAPVLMVHAEYLDDSALTHYEPYGRVNSIDWATGDSFLRIELLYVLAAMGGVDSLQFVYSPNLGDYERTVRKCLGIKEVPLAFLPSQIIIPENMGHHTSLWNAFKKLKIKFWGDLNNYHKESLEHLELHYNAQSDLEALLEALPINKIIGELYRSRYPKYSRPKVSSNILDEPIEPDDFRFIAPYHALIYNGYICWGDVCKAEEAIIRDLRVSEHRNLKMTTRNWQDFCDTMQNKGLSFGMYPDWKRLENMPIKAENFLRLKPLKSN